MNSAFVRKRAAELGLNEAALAITCGVAESYMRNIFKGLTPSKPVLMLLAQNLKCKVDDLIWDGARAVG